MTATVAAIKAGAGASREATRILRRTPPQVWLYHNKPDGSPGLYCRGRITDSVSATFPKKQNNFGDTGEILIRLDHYLSRWVASIPNTPDAMKNIVIRVDHMGGKYRWCGIGKFQQAVKRNGVWFMRLVFVSDEQYMQFLLGAPNPLLPVPYFQFPRTFPLFGPAKWAISLMILLNIIRAENLDARVLPDDPFEMAGYTGPYDVSSWQVLIKADIFTLDDSSTWALLATRMKRMDQVIADALDDAKLTFTCRRYFSDEGETIPGGAMGVTTPANGALVIEIKQNDGYYSADGTVTGGWIIGGFVRSAIGFASGFVEDVETFTGDPTTWSSEYYDPSYRGFGSPSRPWVLVRDNPYSQVDSAELTWAPATATSAIVGGDNQLADQLAGLLIEAIGNLLGYFLLLGFDSAGTIAKDVVMPFLQGTIFAWLQWEHAGRVGDLGWVHLWEVCGSDSENAWSLSAIAALRAAFASTKAEGSHTFSMGGSGRHLPGVHYELGNRVGSTLEVLSDRIWVDQVEEITLSWDYSQNKPHDYVVKVGKTKAALSQSERNAKLLSKSLSMINDLGVRLVS